MTVRGVCALTVALLLPSPLLAQLSTADTSALVARTRATPVRLTQATDQDTALTFDPSTGEAVSILVRTAGAVTGGAIVAECEYGDAVWMPVSATAVAGPLVGSRHGEIVFQSPMRQSYRIDLVGVRCQLRLRDVIRGPGAAWLTILQR